MLRLRRHNRRLLPQHGREAVKDDVGRENVELARRTCCEQLTFLDGRRKYVCASFGGLGHEASLLRTGKNREYGSLRAGKREGVTVLRQLLEVFTKNDRTNGREGRRDGDCGGVSLVVGCLTTIVKIAALLLSRSLCEGAWPALQALSICTLPFGALKQLTLPMPARRVMESIARPVLGITVSQPIVRLCLPNVYRTLKFWKRLLPIYFRAVICQVHQD